MGTEKTMPSLTTCLPSANRAISASTFVLTVFAVVLALLLAPSAHAQTETVLYNFANPRDGANPESNLTPNGAGNFYGTTVNGGQYGMGSVFELSPNGSGGYIESIIYSFCSQSGCSDGANPTLAGVVFDPLGNLYGTTWAGGTENVGTVFQLAPTGDGWTESVIHNFLHNLVDGYNPSSGVIIDSSGNLFGATFNGGEGDGSVYEVSPSGSGWTESVIYDACIQWAGVTMDGHGNLFGAGCQTLFELSPNGGGWTANLIHFFEGGKDGFNPTSAPVLDSYGSVYGTATGGVKNAGVVYKFTLAKKGWKEKLIYSFKDGKDGNDPWAGVTLDACGNVFGTTYKGGKYGLGTVYELAVNGNRYTRKILWSFNGIDGANPYAAVLLDANNVYGTTYQGGSQNIGTVFEVTP
jgi:uncharacterized repeat protein (TIGR03803 family)